MEIIFLLLITVIASCVGTMTGFGTSTIMVPALLIFYPIPQTLLFVGIIHWFGNIWKLVLFKKGFRWKLVLSFGIPGIAATFLGASLVFDISSAILSRIMGTFLIVYVVYLFLKSSFKIKPSLFSGICGGTLSGFLAGVFGIGGAVRGLFLTAGDGDDLYLHTDTTGLRDLTGTQEGFARIGGLERSLAEAEIEITSWTEERDRRWPSAWAVDWEDVDGPVRLLLETRSLEHLGDRGEARQAMGIVTGTLTRGDDELPVLGLCDLLE